MSMVPNLGGLSPQTDAHLTKYRASARYPVTTSYTLPPATTSVLGGVIPDGTTITVDGTGKISAVASSSGKNFTDNSTYYSLMAGSVEQMRVTVDPTFVNYPRLSGGSGTSVFLIADGTGTNLSMEVRGKGSGGIVIGSHRTNYLNVTPSLTTFPPRISAQGSDTDIALALIPKGAAGLQAALQDSTATGGNVRGSNAVDWQTKRASATQVASGASATLAGGQNSTASGSQATVGGGDTNAASGTASTIAGGQNNSVGALHNWCPGGGYADSRSIIGRGVWASGQIGGAGDAQAGEQVLRRNSSGTTPAVLTSDNSGPTTNNQVILRSRMAMAAKILVIARHQTNNSDCAVFSLDVLGFTTSALSGMTVVGGGASIAPVQSSGDGANYRLSVAADTTNGAIQISGTGTTGNTVTWIARVQTVETWF